MSIYIYLYFFKPNNKIEPFSPPVYLRVLGIQRLSHPFYFKENNSLASSARLGTSSLRPLSTPLLQFHAFFCFFVLFLKNPVNITYVNIKVYQTPLTFLFLFFKSVAQNQCKNNRQQVQSASIHSNILFASRNSSRERENSVRKWLPKNVLAALCYVMQVNENWGYQEFDIFAWIDL